MAKAKNESWRYFVKEHSLSIVLLSLMFIQTVYIFFTGIHIFEQEEQDHGSVFTWGEYLIWFSHEYNLSLVADVFGAFLLVTLKIKLRERGSPEAKD